MDINVFRGLLTVVLFVLFVALVARTYSRSRKADYQAAARLPLEDNDGRVTPMENNHADNI